MHRIIFLIAALIILISSESFADTQVFPPENWEMECAGSAHAMTWDGETSVKCKSAADLLALELKNCQPGETLTLNATKDGVDCKKAGGEIRGSFVAHYQPANGYTCTCNGTAGQGSGPHSGSCGSARECTWVPDYDGKSLICKYTEQQIDYTCSDTILGVIKKKYGESFMYRCERPHSETGKCVCPQGTSPKVLWSEGVAIWCNDCNNYTRTTMVCL